MPHRDRPRASTARVLTADGVLVASSNSRNDKSELDELWAQAAATVLGIEQGPRRIKLSERFPLEQTDHALGTHFADVTVIEVDSPAPVLAHYASYRAWSDQAGVPFEQTLKQVNTLLRARLEDGPLRITTRQGVVIARSPYT